jgi:hypothetical protein
LAHTALDAPSGEQCEEQVRRILQSATFRNAATLQVLLQFLAAKALTGSAESLKEYTIGVEALGRKADFDPKVDPIVRVQSHRLRLKLREYYEVEGSRDPILIQFPKGHYVPAFVPMPVSAPMSGKSARDIELDTSAHSSEEPSAAATQPGIEVAIPMAAAPPSHRRGVILVAVIAALAIVAFAYWLGGRSGEKGSNLTSNLTVTTASKSAATANERRVEDFWTRFLAGDTSPIIAYPDAVFLLDDSNDLFRFRHGATDNRGALVDPHVARQFASNPKIVAQAGPLYYENGYTGTGELEGVAMLFGLMGRMGLRPIIKSSRDITPDDLNQHNVILLGSPFQNAAVAQLFTAGDFSFENPDQHLEQWRAQILDAHPHTGEHSNYRTERDPASRVLRADYSLITIGPSVTPGRSIAILGGLDTTGTEGATMFATSSFGVDQLERALASSGNGSKGEFRPFQALVRVDLAKGYQVLGADLVSLHLLPSKRPADPAPAAR